MLPRKSYYEENKGLWKKGGRYYYYEPKEDKGGLVVKHGRFILKWD